MLTGALALAAAGATAARDDAGDLIRRARRQAASGRFADAESTLVAAERMARGDERAEAMYLRAGMVRSTRDAQLLYEGIVAEFPRSKWGQPAALELAKIHFAMGRYELARDVLRDSNACASSDEACLFEGLANLMVRDFAAAMQSLDRVRRGRYRTWAAVAMAEAESEAGRRAEACDEYESLTRARVSPTAWYRYAECLEEAGDRAGARRQYEALEQAFAQTPEAVRAASKLAPPEPAEPAPEREGGEAAIPPGKGYTVQFGSFADRANAIKLASKIKKMYPNVRIDSELINYREVFRVRCGYYASRGEAQSAGEEMSRRLEEPFTVMPVRPAP